MIHHQPSIQRTVSSVLCLTALSLVGGCSSERGGNVEDVPRVPRAEAIRTVNDYAIRTETLTGAKRTTTDRQVHTTSCKGRQGEYPETVYYANLNLQIAPIPEDQQLPTLRRLRDHWQKEGYTIKQDRVFPDGRTGELAVENPADGFEISLVSTEPPNAFAVTISSPCYYSDESGPPLSPTTTTGP